MEAVATSAEVTVLVWSAVLLLVQIVAQATAALRGDAGRRVRRG